MNLKTSLKLYCKKLKNGNEVIQTFHFNQVKFQHSQTFDTFLSELQSKAAVCNFPDANRLIRDKYSVQCKQLAAKTTAARKKLDSRSGLGKLRPAGLMQPTKAFCAARQHQ